MIRFIAREVRFLATELTIPLLIVGIPLAYAFTLVVFFPKP